MRDTVTQWDMRIENYATHQVDTFCVYICNGYYVAVVYVRLL